MRKIIHSEDGKYFKLYEYVNERNYDSSPHVEQGYVGLRKNVSGDWISIEYIDDYKNWEEE